ncbi:TPA: hypothetical protein DCQ44_02510 [Candidatus Taylorbacteria bacterium]|nr:hypothetical protein [Candidatus Taylorbacteria bacterium]
MYPQNNVPAQAVASVAPVNVDSGFENLQKLLMIFIFILTICMFSYWGYQAVMYILSVSFNVVTEFTPYDMLIGIIAMIASASLFAGSTMWWKRNVTAENFLKFGTIGFVVKDILEIPNAIVPLTLVAQVTRYNLTVAASAIGYDLFKIGFWIFALCIFMYAIKKYRAMGTV